MGIANITTAPGYTSKAVPFQFKATGFLNKGFVAAAAVYFYKEAHLPYYKEIYKAVFPFGVGYSLGGFIDPAPNPNALMAPSGGQFQVAADYPALVGSINSMTAAQVRA